MIYTRKTFQQQTAPGYFDFSSQQTAKTKAMVAWFDAWTARIEAQVNLFDDTFRLWATRNYSAVTVTMTPWLLYLMNQNGIGWFNGTIAQTVQLLTYFSKAYPANIVLCFQQLFEFLLTNLAWTVDTGTIYFASNTPAQSAETLLIYSTSGTAPTTPVAQTYTALTWAAPTGWSKTAASATYYARGYLSAGNIVWMSPRSTTGITMTSDAANLAGLPATPTTGDICNVYSDGTGDIGAVYYYDGSVWRKTTTPNANQGQVVNGLPPIPGSAVWSTGSGYTSSGDVPPVTGPSQGYGYYGTYGIYLTNSKVIDIHLNLTTAGVANLGMIVFLLRRIKPTLNILMLKYTTPTNPNITELNVSDSGAV